jgi:flagellar motor switch/type III secretory pathway protein FliN
MRIRPHKIINRTERALIERRLLERLREWAERYAIVPLAPRCRMRLAQDRPDESVPPVAAWWRCEQGGVQVLALGLPGDWPATLGRLLLPASVLETGAQPEGSVLPALGIELLQELGETLLDARREAKPVARRQWREEPPATPPTPTADGFRESVAVTCGFEGVLAIHLRVETATIEACLGASTLPSPRGLAGGRLSDALRAERVTLEAVLGEAELSAAELMSVRVGDVLKLNRALHEPLELQVRGGGVVCGARLGLHGGRTALQLTTELPPAVERSSVSG